jgi:hypothetical protein
MNQKPGYSTFKQTNRIYKGLTRGGKYLLNGTEFEDLKQLAHYGLPQTDFYEITHKKEEIWEHLFSFLWIRPPATVDSQLEMHSFAISSAGGKTSLAALKDLVQLFH